MSTTETERPAWAGDPDVLESIVGTAVEQRDWRGVDAALHLLAVADPRRCERLVAVMRLAVDARINRLFEEYGDDD